MDELVKNAYNDLQNGFVGARKLFLKLQKTFPDLTMKEVEEALEEIADFQLLKERKRKKYYNSIVANYPMHNVELDIIIYSRFKLNNYQYILTCVDTYSRYAKAEPMTNLEMPNVLEKVKKIFSEMGGTPETVNCDNGFNNKVFNNYCDTNNIQRYYSEAGDVRHNGIVERFNKTLALALQRARLAGHKQWYKILPVIIDNYNNTYHSTIKHTPLEVFTLEHRNEQTITVVHEQLQVGDIVRLSIEKKKFDKNDKIKYSTNIYIIDEKIGKKYKIKEIKTGKIEKRLYREDELLKTTNEDNEAIEKVVEDIEEQNKDQQIDRKLRFEGLLDKNTKEKIEQIKEDIKKEQKKEIEQAINNRPKRERKQTQFYRP